jgi:hypothetical protein
MDSLEEAAIQVVGELDGVPFGQWTGKSITDVWRDDVFYAS